MISLAQLKPILRAISNLTFSPRGRVAVRSNRAEARKAVAVRAASETRARTLIRAKLGDPKGQRKERDEVEVFNGLWFGVHRYEIRRSERIFEYWLNWSKR